MKPIHICTDLGLRLPEIAASIIVYRGEIEQERSLLALADGKIQNIG